MNENEEEARRVLVHRGAKNLSLFHRLGITLVILGMIQSLAPPCVRPTRGSLRLAARFRIALASLNVSDLSLRLVSPASEIESESRQDQESDEESHDMEDLGETFVCPETATLRRSPQRSFPPSPHGSIPLPGRGSERTLSALQQAWALPILAADASNLASRICCFRC
jgi:hypothetical protein